MVPWIPWSYIIIEQWTFFILHHFDDSPLFHLITYQLSLVTHHNFQIQVFQVFHRVNSFGYTWHYDLIRYVISHQKINCKLTKSSNPSSKSNHISICMLSYHRTDFEQICICIIDSGSADSTYQENDCLTWSCDIWIPHGWRFQIQEELDEDQIKVSKRILNEGLTNLLLGIRVRYMVDGFKVMGSLEFQHSCEFLISLIIFDYINIICVSDPCCNLLVGSWLIYC